jgi:hypothetical protein
MSLDMETEYAWNYLIDKLNYAEEDAVKGKDVKFVIIYSYSAIPSLTIITFRMLMFAFLSRKGIDVDFLKKGKWLSKDINLSNKLWEGILITQGNPLDLIPKERMYADALSFFTQNNRVMHRNMVSHDFPNSLSHSKYIHVADIKKHMFYLIHSMARIKSYC